MKILNSIFSVLWLFSVSRFEIFTSPYSNYIMTLSVLYNVYFDSVLGVSHYVALGSVADIKAPANYQ